MLILSNNLYSQTSESINIKNLNVKKGTVVIGGFSEVATVTSISEVDNLLPEQKNIIKKLIITGTSFSSKDLVAIKTIGADDGELPNLESIELKNMTEVLNLLFYNGSNNWLESFSAPKATNIGHHAFSGCRSLAKLILGGTNVIVDGDKFDNFITNQVDLYLSEEEYNTVTSANHNEWENKTWKSITKIIP